MERQNEFLYYVNIFKRRMWIFIVPALIAMFICTLAALIWPSEYKSEAVILIETQDISEDLVQSHVSGLIEERLRSLNQRVLSRSLLLDLIKEYDLYTEYSSSTPASELTDVMREDIKVEMVTTEVHNVEMAKTGVATYAFTLAYEGRSPEKVLQVTNRLLTLYLEENSKQREEQSRSTLDYLKSRLEELKVQIAESEDTFSEFKEGNSYSLPEMLGPNLTAQQRIESDVLRMRDRIYWLTVRYNHWTSELANTPRYIKVRDTGGVRVISPEEELDQMRRQYVEFIATHAKEHPDAVVLKKQIDALEEQTKFRQDLSEYSEELERKENKLKEYKERYTPNHPDVKRLQAEVLQLHNDIDTMSQRYMIKPKHEETELNPQWVHAKNQVAEQRSDLERFNAEKISLEEQLAEYKARIARTPQVELRYNVLNAELETLKSEREQLTQRMLAAKEAKGLEDSGLGEKFTVVDPPLLPEEPSKPNRPILLVLGLILSMGLGTITGTLAEVMDRSVHTSDVLSRLTRKPVLATIPFIGDDNTATKLTPRKLMALVLFSVAIMVGLIVFHYLIYPLDQIWERLLIGMGLF